MRARQEDGLHEPFPALGQFAQESSGELLASKQKQKEAHCYSQLKSDIKMAMLTDDRVRERPKLLNLTD